MTFRAYLTELVGTFLLVFFCAGVICAAQMTTDRFPVGLVGIAVAQGAALAVLLSITTLVSQGCLNPAVTLGLWVTKRFDFGRGFCLVVMQLMGAAFAGALIVALFPQSTLEASFAGTPHLYDFYRPAEDSRPWLAGSAAEVVLTFLLTLTLLTTVLDPKRAEWRWAPLLPGLALTAGV